MGERLAYATAIGWSFHHRESRGQARQILGAQLVPVAHESALGVGLGPAVFFAGRVVPKRIEVRSPDGRTRVVAVPDVQWRVRMVGAMLILIGALAAITMLGRLR